MHNSNNGVKDMATRRISASLNEELVRKIDRARGKMVPRSAYIRMLLEKALKEQPRPVTAPQKR